MIPTRKCFGALEVGDVIRSDRFAQGYYLCGGPEPYVPYAYLHVNKLPFSDRSLNGQKAAPANDPKRAQIWYMIEALEKRANGGIHIKAVGLDSRGVPSPDYRGHIIIDIPDIAGTGWEVDYWGRMNSDRTQIVYTIPKVPVTPTIEKVHVPLNPPQDGPYR